MAQVCSLDLREKVIEYRKEGRRKMETARVFRLNRKIIYRWEKRQKEGRLAVTKRKVYKPQKLDPEALREYIKNNPDMTLKEIGAAFGASDASVLYRIRQLGITYKKVI
ncbi:MAG: transposase [Puniceicoccales bacterium]|jgi:transposase|nr:transposase [Puniceicoccales bacterium]